MQFEQEKKTWKNLSSDMKITQHTTYKQRQMPDMMVYNSQEAFTMLNGIFFCFYFKFALLSFLLQMDESEINVCPFINISLNSNEEI